jgi:hypothetical protein
MIMTSKENIKVNSRQYYLPEAEASGIPHGQQAVHKQLVGSKNICSSTNEKHPASAPKARSCPSGALGRQRDGFRIACKMLRMAGKLDFVDLPAPKRNESLVDYMVRAGLSKNQYEAAEGLLVAAGLQKVRNELLDILPPPV